MTKFFKKEFLYFFICPNFALTRSFETQNTTIKSGYMLHIAAFTFNPFQENTYLLINEKKECLIIDPGMYDETENQKLMAYIEQHELIPGKIINTHAHIDHIMGVDALKQKYQIPFGLHVKETPVLSGAVGSAMLFGLNFKIAPTVDFNIEEQKDLYFGEDKIEVRLAPGHSPGSIVFYCPKEGFAFGGDVLFQGSVGRTDLPGGDTETLIQSIREQLYTLPGETIIYPGHGPATTIAQEKRTNAFVKG
jgi:glyoxylase-like metal-dependent hydrolase (beta-lactamase superfamily II)